MCEKLEVHIEEGSKTLLWVNSSCSSEPGWLLEDIIECQFSQIKILKSQIWLLHKKINNDSWQNRLHVL